jgi:uncharacterized protein
MSAAVIADAGPLVALLNRRERHHEWCHEQFKRLRPPLVTCEAVVSEACFLLRSIAGGVDALVQLLARGVVTTPFCLADELSPVARLLARYRSTPMSLADACLVRMAERYANGTVFTLDRHFRIYRKNGRLVIPTLIPE